MNTSSKSSRKPELWLRRGQLLASPLRPRICLPRLNKQIHGPRNDRMDSHPHRQQEMTTMKTHFSRTTRSISKVKQVCLQIPKLIEGTIKDTYAPRDRPSPDNSSAPSTTAWDSLRARAAQPKSPPPEPKEKNIWGEDK